MTLALLAAGLFDGFFNVIAGFLDVLYGLTNSYGGAIILLTIIVMIITAPLTLKSTRSMLEMQRHQPELKRLQAQYKDDRERLNQEMMAFYKEHSINPLSGCVPMLIQAPIFILLYGALRGVGNRDGGVVSSIGRVAGELATDAPFNAWRLHDAVFYPDHLNADSALFKNLHARNEMSFFGVDLAITPMDSLKLGFTTALPFIVLIVLMFVTQLIQNRQIQGRNRGAEVNPQQQMIMKIMPFMLPIFSLALPAGLSLYYFVQGLCRIGLQSYITKQVYEPHHARVEQDKTTAKVVNTTGTKKPNSKSGNPAKASSNGSANKSPAARKNAGGKSAQQGRKSGGQRAGGSSRSQSGSSKNKKG